MARYTFKDATASVDLGMNFGRYAQARIGYAYDERNVSVDIGSELLPAGRSVDAGITVSADFDSRDTAFNPTRGLALALEYMRSDDGLGADRSWDRAELGVGMAVPLRNDVLWVTLAGGSDLGSDLPADRTFALGGPASFPGLELGELRVDGYWTVGTSYLWKVKDVLPIRNLALYAGVQLVGGAIYDRIDDGADGDIYGGSVFLTGRTMVGPLTVGIGATSRIRGACGSASAARSGTARFWRRAFFADRGSCRFRSKDETGFASLAAGLSAAGLRQQVDVVDSRAQNLLSAARDLRACCRVRDLLPGGLLRTIVKPFFPFSAARACCRTATCCREACCERERSRSSSALSPEEFGDWSFGGRPPGHTSISSAHQHIAHQDTHRFPDEMQLFALWRGRANAYTYICVVRSGSVTYHKEV